MRLVRIYSMLSAIIFNAVVLLVLIILFLRDKEKFKKAITIAYVSLKKLLPLLLIIFFLMLLLQFILSESFIVDTVKQSTGLKGYVITALLGGIINIPLFMTFPIGGELLRSGVNPGLIGVLISSLVMVHLFTLPVEIKYLGTKYAVLRNGLSFIAAIIIGVLIGVLF